MGAVELPVADAKRSRFGLDVLGRDGLQASVGVKWNLQALPFRDRWSMRPTLATCPTAPCVSGMTSVGSCISRIGSMVPPGETYAFTASLVYSSIREASAVAPV